MKDSTVQTIGYWDKKEKQKYNVIQDNYKLKGSDTTSKERIKYKVEVTILDSTAKSYTIEWLYKNFSVETDNEVMKKIMSLSQDMRVVIKTDENGTFEEVENWQQVRDFMKKVTTKIREEYKDIPKMDDFLKQIEKTYSTKEAIEASCINEIQQFYTFHGVKYKLGDTLEGQLKVPNIYGDTPFDSDFIAFVDEINEKDNNYILRASQVVNEEQLTEATYGFMVALAKKMAVDPPKKEDLNDVKNETVTASRIHGSGWVIYSIQTQTVNYGDATSIKECEIEIEL